ncbi:MAG: DUF5985 family protein [Opitutus sp.]
MNSKELVLLLSGAILFGYIAIGSLFWRYWRMTRDRLFASFAVSFWILALERILLVAGGSEAHPSPAIYVTRLVAYVVLIVAIIGKNRKPPLADGE